MGDSGFLVIGQLSGNEQQLYVKYHSPQQEHSFGCPYQLGHYKGADAPEDAMLMTVTVGPHPCFPRVEGVPPCLAA